MENNLIVVKQLPIIEERLKTLSKEITVKVNNATALVCNEESVKTVKDVRATLNKEFKELEEQRKAVKKAVLDPYEKFETIYKECVTDKFKTADTELKNKIDAVESDLKAQKELEIKEYFEELKVANHIDFVDYKQANINVTLTASKKSLKEQAKSFIDKINNDLNTLETLEKRNEMLIEYKSNGYNLNDAVAEVNNRMAALEREKEIQEKQKAEREKIQANIDKFRDALEPIAAPVVEEKEYVINFKVIATKEKLVELKKFLNDGGYKYE